MALENILMELGAKLDANTAAIKAAIASGAMSLKAPPADPAAARDPAPDDAVTEAAEKTTRGRGRPPKEQTRKYSSDEVAAAAAKVKKELGIDKAMALRDEYAGPGKRLADIPEAKFGAFIAAAEALIVAAAAADAQEEQDEEDL